MSAGFQIPFMAVLVFCGVMFFWHGVTQGETIVDDRFGSLEEPDDLISGLVFLGQFVGAFAGLIFDLITFAEVPWDWLRWTLILICDSTLILGIAILISGFL